MLTTIININNNYHSNDSAFPMLDPKRSYQETQHFFPHIPARLLHILNNRWIISLSTKETLDLIRNLKEDYGVEYSILLKEVYNFVNSRHCKNPYRYITNKLFFEQVHHVTMSSELKDINCELKKLIAENPQRETCFTKETPSFHFKLLYMVGFLLSSALLTHAETVAHQDSSVDFHDPFAGLLPTNFNNVTFDNYFIGPFAVKNYTADDFYSRLIFAPAFQNKDKKELDDIKIKIMEQFNLAKFLSQNQFFNHIDFVLSRIIRIKVMLGPYFHDGRRVGGQYRHNSGEIKLTMYLIISDNPYEKDQLHKVLIHEFWHALMAFINDNCLCGLSNANACNVNDHSYKLSPYDTSPINTYENFKKLIDKGSDRAVNHFLKLIRKNQRSPQEMTSDEQSALNKYEEAAKLYIPRYITISNYTGSINKLEEQMNRNEVPLIPMPLYNNLGLFVYRIEKDPLDNNHTVAGFRVDKLEKKQLALIRDAEYTSLLVTGYENQNYTEELISYDKVMEKDAYFSEFGMPVISTFFKELHRHHNKRFKKYLDRCSHELNPNSDEDISLTSP